MNKSGFTLAELLITITIIAVAASLAAPTISNIMPNQDKFKVVKYHAQISSTVNDLLSIEGIYYNPLTGGSCSGLDCTARPLFPPYNTADYEGNDKFRNLLFNKIGIDDDGMLPDGSKWEIDDDRHITIDLNGDDRGDNCTYDNNCEKPDRFELSVDKDGNVVGVDMLTQVYLADPHNMHNKKRDLLKAKEKLEEN